MWDLPVHSSLYPPRPFLNWRHTSLVPSCFQQEVTSYLRVELSHTWVSLELWGVNIIWACWFACVCFVDLLVTFSADISLWNRSCSTSLVKQSSGMAASLSSSAVNLDAKSFHSFFVILFLLSVLFTLWPALVLFGKYLFEGPQLICSWNSFLICITLLLHIRVMSVFLSVFPIWRGLWPFKNFLLLLIAIINLLNSKDK